MDDPRPVSEATTEALTFVRRLLENRADLLPDGLPFDAAVALGQLMTQFLHAQAIHRGIEERDEVLAYSLDWIDRQISNCTPRAPRNGDGQS
jgi:hypothetical protein